MQVLVERLKNDITRLPAIKAFVRIADSPLQLSMSSIQQSLVTHLLSYLQMANRTLRQGGLDALDVSVAASSPSCTCKFEERDYCPEYQLTETATASQSTIKALFQCTSSDVWHPFGMQPLWNWHTKISPVTLAHDHAQKGSGVRRRSVSIQVLSYPAMNACRPCFRTPPSRIACHWIRLPGLLRPWLMTQTCS